MIPRMMTAGLAAVVLVAAALPGAGEDRGTPGPIRVAQKTQDGGNAPRNARTGDEPALTKARVAPAPSAPARRFAPDFPQGKVQGHRMGFVSYVGSFKLEGFEATGLYRWRDGFPSLYRFYRGQFQSAGTFPVRFGGRGSVTGFQRNYLALVYKDVDYNFWLAFSSSPNPDGTYNLAFSENVADPSGWYWWDADMKGFPSGN